MVKRAIKCRVCTKSDFEPVFNFGPTPLANEFLNKLQIDKEELFFPLEVIFCRNCYFLQLAHVVDPRILFGKYVYVSSTSKVFVDHFKRFSVSIFQRFSLSKTSLVIDIGSNDGILLKPFRKLGTNVLGIEPAKHIASMAIKDGIPTIAKYFNRKVSEQIVKKYGHADIVAATNVFAHIDDLDEVIRGLKNLLDKNGVFIIEAPYLIDFFKKKYFDLVYHEHLSYWSVSSLTKLFARFNMNIFDVEKVSVHGGSIRIFVQKKEGKHRIEKTVKDMIENEKKNHLYEVSTYKKFQLEVMNAKIELLTLLLKLKEQGKTVAGYGAPAKGNTLLNCFGIGRETLEYIVDDSSWKQGLFSPGKKIPVVSNEKIVSDRPDYLFILAWNFAESIIENNKAFSKAGGKFIIPFPKPKIV